jgi:hypothetical protein
VVKHGQSGQPAEPVRRPGRDHIELLRVHRLHHVIEARTFVPALLPEATSPATIAARSTSLGVLHRAHRISNQGKPPFTAWSIVGDGDGSIGSPDRLRVEVMRLIRKER